MPLEDAERVRRLQLVTEAALAHLDLDELLPALLDRTKEALDADTVAILMLDDESRELVARAAVGLEEEVQRGVRIPFGRGFAGRIAAEARPVFLPDVSQADVLNPLLREKGVASLLGVPLVAHGTVLGVLHVGTLAPRQFGSEDVDLLQLVADRAAIAIEHARLFAAERRARDRLERLQSVTDAALAHLDLDELLAELLTRIRVILEADSAAVLLVDPDAGELVARAAVGLEEEVERGVRVPIGRGFAGRVAAEGRAIFLPDVGHADVVNPLLREKGIASLLGVPLLDEGKVIGVLHVGTLTPREFGAEDIDLLQLVADRAAIAIGRARVHAATRELDELKTSFVAIASHELRTPATVVYGVLATLHRRQEILGTPTGRQLLADAYHQADRLRRLLEELLDLSRLDARAVLVRPRPIVLHSVVSEVVESTGVDADAVHVRVPHDLAVVADRIVLERVLSNLVTNAIRHGRPPVEVTVEQRDRHLRIAVEDAGAGVPEDVQPRVFERFQRAGDEPGTGLGLSIARGYARAHGGDLIYAPRDRGARFELLIPQG